jgi:hypothetical protein
LSEDLIIKIIGGNFYNFYQNILKWGSIWVIC